MRKVHKILFIVLFAVIVVFSINCEVHASEDERTSYGETMGEKKLKDYFWIVVEGDGGKKTLEHKVQNTKGGYDLFLTEEYGKLSHYSITRLYVIFTSDDMQQSYVKQSTCKDAKDDFVFCMGWTYSLPIDKEDWICFEIEINPTQASEYNVEKGFGCSILIEKYHTFNLNIHYEVSNADVQEGLEKFYGGTVPVNPADFPKDKSHELYPVEYLNAYQLSGSSEEFVEEYVIERRMTLTDLYMAQATGTRYNVTTRYKL